MYKRQIDYQYKNVIKAIQRPSKLNLQFIYIRSVTTSYSLPIPCHPTSYVRTCLEANTFRIATFVGSELYVLLCWERRLYVSLIVLVRGRKFKGPIHIVTGSESSM